MSHTRKTLYRDGQTTTHLVDSSHEVADVILLANKPFDRLHRGRGCSSLQRGTLACFDRE